MLKTTTAVGKPDDSDRPAAAAAGRILDELRFGVLVTDGEGVVIDANETARRTVAAAHGSWPDEATCCSLFGCHRHEPLHQHCIARLAAESEEPLTELRIGLPAERPTHAAWITAARLAEDGSTVVMHLRPAPLHDRRRRTKVHWDSEPELQIRALGRTEVEVEGIAVEGDWLLQRPGQLLKYLVSRRGRPAHVDEIVEALWPRAERPGRSTVRFFVHALRERLEPGRASRAPSAFITSTSSTYALDPRVAVDLDDFETLAAVAEQVPATTLDKRPDAVASLKQALDLYRGDLFEEEPYAEWAFPERERFRNLAYQAVSVLVEHCRANDDAATARSYLERCIDLWPLDQRLHHALIGLLLEQGRHGDAERRYNAFRKRLRDVFDEEPRFELTDFVNSRP
ncbi:MAG: BTAD domain-containing putative transcriptional regulator [Actinomycetota bacterium]